MDKIQKKLRRMIIESSFLAKACHIGSSLSAIDIIWDIYNKMGKNDLFIFSKASGACALYTVLAEKGYFPKNKVAYYLKKFPLASHKVPGVLIDSGSLGHGLPQAVGLALANRERKVWCLMSDAELQEGTTYESLLFKKQHKLDNLIIYCDHNGFQACGKIKDILDIPWKFVKSYGVKVINTIKGSGVSFMENQNIWHYQNLDETTYKKAICQLAD
jgi:transketolase